MSWRRRFGLLSVWMAATVLRAESPQEAARRAMEASVARQVAAVTAMRLSIERQRAAAVPAPSPASPPSEPATSFFTLSWPAIGAACDPLTSAELNPLLQQAARQEGLEESLLRTVAEQESGLRACAVSPKGAMGLMQLMPATAAELGVQDPFDPQENLLSGARYLKQLLTRFGGNVALALGAYNAGPARVAESGGVPAIPETTAYVRDILSKLPVP